MKKIIIYAVLSVILVVPIAVIIIIAIMSRPQNDYITETYEYDFSDLQTYSVDQTNLHEVINCPAFFDSDETIYDYVKLDMESDVLNLKNAGDYVTEGDVLCFIDGSPYYSKTEGVVKNTVSGMGDILFEIQKTNVSRLKVWLPIEYFSCAKNAEVFFEYCGKKYDKLKYISKEKSCDRTKKYFCSYYEFKNNNCVFGGEASVNVRTGKVSKNALVVPTICIFKEKSKYYVETIDQSGTVKKQYVALGLTGDNLIEIIPAEEAPLYSGMTVVANDKNIFLIDEEAPSLQEDNSENDE